MPSLTAGTGAFALTGYGTAPRMHPQAGVFTLTPQDAGLGRAFEVDFSLPTSIRLPRLNAELPFVGPNGNPTQQAMRWWQNVVERLEGAYSGLSEAVTAIQTAYNAAAQATTTATEARSVADQAQTTATEAAENIEAIQSGELALDGINVGGTRYVNSGGTLVAEP